MLTRISLQTINHTGTKVDFFYIFGV